MKAVVVLLLCLVGCCMAYSDVDDEFDFDEMAGNRTQFQEFLYCYLDKGPCTTKFMTIGKSHTEEATLNFCANCSDIQKHMFHVFINAIKTHFPEELDEFINKYARNDRKHFEQLERIVEKYKDINNLVKK